MPTLASAAPGAAPAMANRQRLRLYQRNHLPSMTAIDLEITIRRQKQRRVVDLRQANQCSIRQRRGHILIPFEKCTDRANLLLEHEGQLNDASLNELQGQRRIKTGAPEQKAGLSDHCLTAQQWRRPSPELLNSPFVMGVVATQQRYPRSRIKQNRHERLAPKSARNAGLVDRSAGPPSQQPTRSANRSAAEGGAASSTPCSGDWRNAINARRTNSDLLRWRR